MFFKLLQNASLLLLCYTLSTTSSKIKNSLDKNPASKFSLKAEDTTNTNSTQFMSDFKSNIRLVISLLPYVLALTQIVTIQHLFYNNTTILLPACHNHIDSPFHQKCILAGGGCFLSTLYAAFIVTFAVGCLSIAFRIPESGIASIKKCWIISTFLISAFVHLIGWEILPGPRLAKEDNSYLYIPYVPITLIVMWISYLGSFTVILLSSL